jgi:hypothetical protein
VGQERMASASRGVQQEVVELRRGWGRGGGLSTGVRGGRDQESDLLIYIATMSLLVALRARPGACNIYIYIHTHIYIYIHTYILAYIHTYIYTYMHTYIHTCIHAYIHTYLHTCIHTYI